MNRKSKTLTVSNLLFHLLTGRLFRLWMWSHTDLQTLCFAFSSATTIWILDFLCSAKFFSKYGINAHLASLHICRWSRLVHSFVQKKFEKKLFCCSVFFFYLNCPHFVIVLERLLRISRFLAFDLAPFDLEKSTA